MKKFATTLTVSGLLGFLILEALKIVLAPVAGWLMGILAVALKIALIVLGVGLGIVVLALSIWAFRRYRKSRRVVDPE